MYRMAHEKLARRLADQRGPNLQYRTPDDVQRGYPKYVEFYNRINLDNWCVWLVI